MGSRRLSSGSARPLSFTVRQHVSAVPNSTLYFVVLIGAILATTVGTLYGLWQAVSGRRGSVMAAASVAAVTSIAVFYLADLASWLVTRRATTTAFWLGFFAAASSFGLVLAHQVRHHQLRATGIVAASVFGLISTVVLGTFLGIYVGCRFGDCTLP
jgi:MFS family permease